MSEFSRWLTRKYPEYFWEQEAPPMQQNPPAQSAAEILRQRLQRRSGAGGQGGAPAQQNQDAKAAAERIQPNKLQQNDNYIRGNPDYQPNKLQQNEFDTNTLKKLFSNLQLAKKGNTIFWDNVGKMDKMNLYAYAKSKGINLNSNDIEENPSKFNQTLLNLYNTIGQNLPVD